jgi:hypothetical protein|nr:MAG: hypothetical protein [Bacteriophage sp.]
MRLIDADALYNRFWEREWYDNADRDECACVDIDNAPTVDAVPVVRCKNCARWDDDPDTYGADDGPKGKCMKSFETMCADDFCSYGKPKEG